MTRPFSMPRWSSRLTALLAAMVLAGCASPHFEQPVLDVPLAYKEAATPVVAADGTRWQAAQPAESQLRGRWWLAFGDRQLTDLIDEATAASPSLHSAASRVRQARALAGIAASDRVPQVGAGIEAQRSRPSGTRLALPDGAPTAVGNLYQARLAASYELDLFGRVGAGVTAARMDAQSALATYQSVLLSLQADVAQTYFRLRAIDAELESLRRTVQLREQGVSINQRRFDHGDIGEFDLARARTELATSRALALGVERERATAEHALAVLLGKPPASFTLQALPLHEAALPAVPAGLPSRLLERRPDIAAAQHAMMAANARIGVARAAMFPAVSLTGALGSQSGSAGNLFQWSARSWVLGALLSMPVIDGGRNRANVARSQAQLEEAVGLYRQSLLAAFAEVEDNLAGLRVLAGQRSEIDSAVAAARRSADLAQKLYDAGRSSYLDLLDAQRNLAALEREAVQLRGSQAITTVALIRALGGGWGEETADKVAAR